MRKFLFGGLVATAFIPFVGIWLVGKLVEALDQGDIVLDIDFVDDDDYD